MIKQLLLPLWVSAVCTLPVVSLAADGPDLARPDRQEMRRYIASRIADDQAKEIIERSKREVEEEKKRAAADAERFWHERAERLAKCNEIYRLRNPDECDTSLPITWMQMGQPAPGYTLDERIERNLLGICAYAATVKEARKLGCLPSE